MSRRVVSTISLGCAKNLVDTECVLAAFAEAGWLIAAEPQDADVILINTCGFIADAREESFGAIADAVRLKETAAVRAVVVFGCLVQLMRERLARRFLEVDAWVGLTEPRSVVDACEKAVRGRSSRVVFAPDPSARPIDGGPRLRVTPKHFAYLRIAEGCDNRCRYCQIPSIRGPLRSKPMEQVIGEAGDLIADGARELIVIAQDTTAYGMDLYGGARLPDLLRQLRALGGIEWLRLLYTHPAHFSDELIAMLAEGGALIPYVDLPVQHGSDRVLNRMGRNVTSDALRRLLGAVRAAVPGAVVRSSVIVGFPGEGEAEFAELMEFVREARFERLGAFAYSREEGTPAADLDGQVPAEVTTARLAALMDLQHRIAEEQGAALVGTEVRAVVDAGSDGGWIGRTVRDTPDVDGVIRFEDADLRPGTFGRAVVTGATGYDLVGRMLK